ncbi:efflux RND transporter periplasmic adaptor subunit [Schleiferia thermophila]|mgnify:CR=1 FL=1|jgi:membrane fusion protein (multidrug efflux system)|uniref:Membrane fusion protein (Multidrug efflux system) n=2 Tax=Schleiferia thermophila TaxID=884107 RepID=A0A369A305_9FLAO|nr:efflux RND transporter periplasmic adaptor subunit [Schleiferia thermophila]KFD38896.1 secretion protein HylD [Schleiferia thermophila str. Yellowstone]PMB20774.1 efflux RND transporter periplasmic adaptor subunit [Fischerella thermalis CCMEE 5319]RCX03692.1 membrane fusion protein (multidrug efflux system) [Schleiferia thermophila]GCD79926.1 hemolysin D [Schleiferia thermophila]
MQKVWIIRTIIISIIFLLISTYDFDFKILKSLKLWNLTHITEKGKVSLSILLRFEFNMKIRHFCKAIGSLLVLMSCQNVQENVDTAEYVKVMKVSTTDTTLDEEFIAEIKALKNVEIRSRLKGYLEEIYVDEGKPVVKGQPMFKINDEEYKLNLAKATAKVKNAIAAEKNAALELERVRRLAESSIVSPSELTLAESKYTAAKADVEEAEAEEKMALFQLNFTLIKAPFSGLIDRINQRQGSLVDEGTLLTTISELDKVYAYFNISEREYLQLKNEFSDNSFIGQKVYLKLVDGNVYPEAGMIETMESEFEASTGNISVRAVFPNSRRILKHGSTGRIIFSRQVRDGIFIPQRAVMEIQDKYYVYIVDTNKRAKMIAIKPKKRITNFYWIESGLQPGNLLITEGIQKIKNNSLVTF